MTTLNLKIGKATLQTLNTESVITTVYIIGVDKDDSETIVQEWIDGLDNTNYLFGAQTGNSTEFENGFVVAINI